MLLTNTQCLDIVDVHSSILTRVLFPQRWTQFCLTIVDVIVGLWKLNNLIADSGLSAAVAAAEPRSTAMKL